MNIYHFNCATIGGLKYSGEHLICHTLLIDLGNNHLVLVDTGLGTQDFANATPRFGFGFAKVYARPVNDSSLSAINQVAKMGFDPHDVKDIVLTHMDLDHVGGLVDFPWANVHVFKTEYDAAMKPLTFQEKHRYPYALFEHNPKFITYTDDGEEWNDFNTVRSLKGLPEDIFLIPTIGHSRGHAAVVIRQNNEKYMVHAGDSYFDPAELRGQKAQTELAIFEHFNQWNKENRLENLSKLNQILIDQPNTEMFCAHNPMELHKFQNASKLEKQLIINHPEKF